MKNDNEPTRVRLLSKRYAHHSPSSGYDRLAALGGEIPHLDRSRFRGRWVPERVAIRFVRRSGVKYYTLDSFYEELAAMRDMLRQPAGTLYHVLYGDDTYRYLSGVSRRRHHPLIATYHQPPAALERRLKYTAHLGSLQTVVVVSRIQIPFFETFLSPDRIFFVPHGVDTEVFKPSPEPADARDPMCLFVGTHQRDFETLLEVIRRLGVQSPGTRLVAVSKERFRHLFDEFRNVEFRSGVPESELIDLYRSARVLLQPLSDCTANNSILEGMACGVPIVATAIGGVGDYVDDSCAVFVPPGDPEAMTAATLRLIEDGEERTRLSKAARTRSAQFEWSATAEQLRDVYRQVNKIAHEP